jgi:NADH:ubiquinone oxidoreductase subunit H
MFIIILIFNGSLLIFGGFFLVGLTLGIRGVVPRCRYDKLIDLI